MENSVLTLKSAKDASELVQEKGGEEALQNELQHAVQGFHYLVNNAVNQYDTLTPKAKPLYFMRFGHIWTSHSRLLRSRI